MCVQACERMQIISGPRRSGDAVGEGKNFGLGPTIFVLTAFVDARCDNGHEDNSHENATCRIIAGSKPQAGVANG
jgi:hypothetical protein